jgi:catechol 2,3-dioxygenase-like lactoylglutathione lyase family enzyme
MAIELDHSIVSSHHATESARQLAELLGVPWGLAAAGPFTAVYVNEGFTLDFIDTDEDFPIQHFCFRVGEADFDAIVGRLQAAGIPYRSEVRGPMDMKVGTQWGGRNLYWQVPDNHMWEILTVSYARQPG